MIKESGELALSYVKTYAYDLCITNSRTEDPLKLPEPIDIHLHLPAGAQKKDGPSAGVAMVRCIRSILDVTSDRLTNNKQNRFVHLYRCLQVLVCLLISL